MFSKACFRFFISAFALVSSMAVAQVPSSHVVNADGTVTFHYFAKNAQSVAVSIESLASLPMTRDANGVWTVTTPVMVPEIYGYTFNVDGNTVLDVTNADMRINYLYPSSALLVPASPPAPWELTAIAHGRLDQHMFTSHIMKHYAQDQVGYIVYTPPGYDARRKGGYPVLYLLHGWSDMDDGWTNAGHAQYILDSVIDAGKAVPMIVVMPEGAGDLTFVLDGHASWEDPSKIDNNVALFSQTLLTEVMPVVEHEYNIASGRRNHAIAGLSMGGLESLTIGLNHPELFAYVGGFSAAIQERKFDEHIPNADARKADFKLLWVACGVDDGLNQPNLDFITWARAKGYTVTAIQTPGAHVWPVWRDDLVHFAPLLFR